MRYLLTPFLACLMLFSVAFGQQDAHYTMYMFNRQVLNPAYAGALEATNVTMLGRFQWVGISGAPRTATASIHGYISKINSGIGGYIIGDQLGTLKTFGAMFNYSYNLNLGTSGNSKLNIGVEGGIMQKGIFVPEEGWRYDQDQIGVDPLLVNLADANTIVPDIGMGLYYHLKLPDNSSNTYPQDRFYLGASVSHLLEPKLDKLLNGLGDSRVSRGINVTSGYTFDLTQNIFLQPSLFFRTDLASHQMDLTTNLFISPMVFGLNYRGGFGAFGNSDSFGGIVGFNANTNLFIGYAYDYTLSGLGSFTSGSHELIISYTFPTLSKLFAPILDTRGKPQ